MKNYDQCAAEYSTLWANRDEPLYLALKKSNPDSDRLEALRSLCATYQVIRGLRTRHDVGKGKKRLAPLLQALDAIEIAYDHRDHPTETVKGFLCLIESHYETRALSLATKVLWFVYRDPIAILDRLAAKSLNVSNQNYEKYYAAWERRFAHDSAEIEDACSNYCTERWFANRVFDLRLFYEGQALLQPKPRKV